jgi:sporulation protein YlmC with PRC-barrel domain
LLENHPDFIFNYTKSGEKTMSRYPHVLSAATMIGTKIINPAGEELGNLKDLMIDLDEGQVNYAVLSFGGFLGLGDKLFAIPWDALTIDPENNAFILDMNKDQLKDAPGFDKDHWPDEAQYQAGWLLDIYDYYGYTPYWMSERDLNQHR